MKFEGGESMSPDLVHPGYGLGMGRTRNQISYWMYSVG